MLDNMAFLTDLYHKKHRLLVEEFTSRNKESTLRVSIQETRTPNGDWEVLMKRRSDVSLMHDIS